MIEQSFPKKMKPTAVRTSLNNIAISKWSSDAVDYHLVEFFMKSCSFVGQKKGAKQQFVEETGQSAMKVLELLGVNGTVMCDSGVSYLNIKKKMLLFQCLY